MKRKWTKKDGTKILIRDMDNEHLLNSIKMLKRFAIHIQRQVELFYMRRPQPTGEAAQDCFDREFDNVMKRDWDDYVPDIYWSLLEYAKKRSFWNGKLEKEFFKWNKTHNKEHAHDPTR